MSTDQIRYKKLGYVELNVTNLEVAKDFYTRVVGLSLSDATSDSLFLRCTDKHHDVVLHQAKLPGLRCVGWEMESEFALEALRSTLVEMNIKVFPLSVKEARASGVSQGFRICEPTTGALLEFYVAMNAAGETFKPSHTKILRLGHVILCSTDAKATERFLEAINFKVSDRLGDSVTFMRCFPNPYHHSFGVARAEHNHFHHLNFMVQDMEDIGRANNRMKEAGVPIVFGPGQHPASESVFFYFLDPDGLTLEYSFGMEEFPENGARAERKLPLEPASIDRWGGRPADKFAQTGTITDGRR